MKESLEGCTPGSENKKISSETNFYNKIIGMPKSGSPLI